MKKYYLMVFNCFISFFALVACLLVWYGDNASVHASANSITGLEYSAIKNNLSEVNTIPIKQTHDGATLSSSPISSASLLVLQKSYNAIAEKCMPAIVSIKISQKYDPSSDYYSYWNIPPELRRHFPPPRSNPNLQRKKEKKPVGTGFLVSKDGYLLSNYHVISKADEISVVFKDSDKEYDVEVIGKDKESDIALLKIIEKGNYPFLKLTDSDKVNVGDIAVAIGNPFGLSHTLTTGVISAKGRTGLGNRYEDFLQTDVAINPGNSGGPLLNIYGEVIGINSMIFSQSGGSIGIGFAISSKMAKRIMEDLQSHGKVTRGWLGVRIEKLPKDIAKALSLNHGIQIVAVESDSPAAKAGLKAGDIILEYNSKKIVSVSKLINSVGNTKVGDTALLKIWRKNKIQTISIVIEKPNDLSEGKTSSQDKKAGGSTDKILKISVANIKANNGVRIVDISNDSPLKVYQIKENDIIQEVDFKPITDVASYQKVIKKVKGKERVILTIKRIGGNNLSYQIFRMVIYF